MSRVWLITGASRGLGRAFAEEALKAGHRMVATARNSEISRFNQGGSNGSYSRSSTVVGLFRRPGTRGPCAKVFKWQEGMTK